jgi:hypothetical protein
MEAERMGDDETQILVKFVTKLQEPYRVDDVPVVS